MQLSSFSKLELEVSTKLYPDLPSETYNDSDSVLKKLLAYILLFIFTLFPIDIVEDLMHPYWKQFDFSTIADTWYYAAAWWITGCGVFGAVTNALVIIVFRR